MLVNICKVKVENAIITDSDLNYSGSLAVDEVILEKADILSYEKVLIANFENGNRFETYIIPAEKNSGIIGLRGAAARMGQTGDRIGFLAFCFLDYEKAKHFKPKIVKLKKGNKI